jgi:hypothetical protein
MYITLLEKSNKTTNITHPYIFFVKRRTHPYIKRKQKALLKEYKQKIKNNYNTGLVLSKPTYWGWAKHQKIEPNYRIEPNKK